MSSDLFLSYASADRDAVLEIRSQLEALGVRTFLDRSNLTAGQPWPKELEDALGSCRGVAVFVGNRPELGTWQLRESWMALDRQARAQAEGESFPVVPVLLPGADPRAGFLFLNSWVDLRGGITDREGIDRLVRAVRAPTDAAEEARPVSPDVCPYRGLEPFRRQDEPLFFGRESFTERLLEKALEHDLVALVGSSGSGKSSVVQAGLLPALGRHPEGRTWEVATFRPSDRPFHCVAHAIAPLRWRDLDDLEQEEKAERLGEQLEQGRNRLEIQVEKVLSGSNGSTRLLLIADQFEELFRETPRESREPFVDALLSAVDGAPLRVVLTLRADFMEHALLLPRKLTDRFDKCIVHLTDRLSPEELARIVRAPADRVGLEFQEGLERVLLKELGEGPGRLPLLEYCLRGLWEERQGALLTHRGYAKIGGVEGALAQRADRALRDLGADLAGAAERLFTRRLVRVAREAEAGRDTKRKAAIAELPSEEREVVAHFSGPDVRLLVADDQSVEIVHEALIEQWNTLGEWIRANRERLRQEQQVRDAKAIEQLAATMPLDDSFVEDPDPLLRAAAERSVVLANESPPFQKLSETLWRLDVLAVKGKTDGTRVRASALAQELRGELRRAVQVRTGNEPPVTTPGQFVDVEPGLRRLPCPPGKEVDASFWMGSEESSDESPVHPVILSPYRMQAQAVTNAEYLYFDPAHGGEPDTLPVVDVSWHEAYAYAAWLGGRLPTEAEWECACRAGTTSRWSFGDEESEIGRYAWTGANSEDRAHPVGELEPNLWGFYDMHGNVWEWVSDWYAEYSPESLVDPQGSVSSASGWRVVRGGSFNDPADDARSAIRARDAPGLRFVGLGFRVVLPPRAEAGT